MGINVEVLQKENLCIMDLQTRDCFVFLKAPSQADYVAVDYYDENSDKKYINIRPNDVFMVISSYTTDDCLIGSAEIMCLRTFEIIRMYITENNSAFNTLRDTLVKIVKPVASITADKIFELCRIEDLKENDVFTILPMETIEPRVCICIESKQRWVSRFNTSCKMVRYIDSDLYIHEVPIGKSLEGIPRRVNGDTVVMKFLNCPSISVPFEFD